jgi:alkanesulfonate monooxygenase SsuD/methylene tetrahydromethanopterin reductase-like flavin-dependent oxidoreductase (luciferase family)
VLGGVILAAVLVRASRILTAGLLISADEVVVRGIYRTQRIPVDDVDHFEEFTETWIRLSTQSVRIRLQPRGKVRVTALQSPPYEGPARPRWTEAVNDLNALVTAGRHRDPAR